MSSPIKLTRPDARRALVRHHFAPCACQAEAFKRLRSVQFDPLAPVGCNHDLVLQARVPGYKVGDWRKLAYEARLVYDGWDKMASLVPFEGWPLRRYIYQIHRRQFEQKIFDDHKNAVELVLKEISDRGPLMPNQFDFQQRKEEWKGSWFGPSVTKQTLRALWHSGLIMTARRKNGQHVYDLTERVVPRQYYSQPLVDANDAVCELVLERHLAMGIVRPAAPPEVWSSEVLTRGKREAMRELVLRGEIAPVDLDGVEAHATADYLALLDQPSLPARVRFIAPLDQFMWDRKMIKHLFGFEYVWEVYVPQAKRRWGYYVLPVLFGDQLVARTEFWCREGILEVRRWSFEPGHPAPTFFSELERALAEFMTYCSATMIVVAADIDPGVRAVAEGLAPA